MCDLAFRSGNSLAVYALTYQDKRGYPDKHTYCSDVQTLVTSVRCSSCERSVTSTLSLGVFAAD